MVTLARFSIASSSLLIVACSGVGIWISIGSYSSEYSTLQKYEFTLKCYECAECESNCERCCENNYLERQKKQMGYDDLQRIGRVTEKCFGYETVKDGIENVTAVEFISATKKFRQPAYSEKATEAFYEPMRYIVHWMVKGTSEEGTDGWTTVHQYENHPSLYSVSSGPDGSYDNGRVVILESGLYLIYAKLAFACVEPDMKWKRILIEVQVHPGTQGSHTIMRDVQEGICGIKGGLLTSYQSGIFPLDEGNKISLRFKAPGNVMLSAEGYKGYRSNIGVTRIGLK